MQHTGIGIARQQAEVERAAYTQSAFRPYFPFVKGNQILHQCQTDARTGGLVITALLIITVKNMGQ